MQFCLIDVAIVVAILERNNTIPISGKRSNLEMLPDDAVPWYAMAIMCVRVCV